MGIYMSSFNFGLKELGSISVVVIAAVWAMFQVVHAGDADLRDSVADLSIQDERERMERVVRDVELDARLNALQTSIETFVKGAQASLDKVVEVEEKLEAHSHD